MGNRNKGKNKIRNKFNRAGGKHAYKTKVKNTKAIYHMERKIEQYSREKIKVPPYQLVHRQVLINGKISTKFSVRRIPLHADRKLRTITLGNTSLKLSIKKCDNETVTGNRIINLDNLKQHVIDITMHSALCEMAQEIAKKGEPCLVLQTEIKRNGLYSILSVLCKGCRKKFDFETSSMNSATRIADVNLRAVWGSISTGGGCSKMQEVFGTLNMPSINQGTFSKIEQTIGNWWEAAFKEEIIKAGMEERRLAIQSGHFHEGVPAITVICDGGWSKRSHKHTYNASGGVGVIFGYETKRLLYLGVRNKYCYICEQGKSDHPHECYKNWNDSSQSMESDMILEGFLEAESLHGLRYTKVIADGDSSVYSKLIENVPVWGPHIKKLECANHACKCLRSNLERLVQDKPEYKGKGKLTKQVRVRLTTAVRCAIKMRSATGNHKQLKKDIRNSVYHVFGIHNNCSDFCKNAPCIQSFAEDKENEDLEGNDCDDLFLHQADLWHIPSESEFEESRFAFTRTTEDVKNIIRDVSVFLNRLADKSERLIGNFTTNLAESWMNIRCKFDGGKVVNRCNRGSWQTRCFGGALRKDLGPAWSPITYQKVTGENPGYFFINTFHRKSKHVVTSLRTQKSDKAKLQRRKRKQKSVAQPSKKAKLDYGPSVLNDTADVTPEKLNKLQSQFYERVVVRTANNIKKVEEETKDQHLSQKWVTERKVRLTSSNFGKVFKRRPTNVSTSIVKNMLYTKFKGNLYTVRGLAQEANTLIEYTNIKKTVKEVQKMGLMIYEDKPFLAASTDGKVLQHNGEVGLIEIKNLLHNNKLSLKQASESVSNFCLKMNEREKLELKKDHEYYFQCQGQLNIFKLPWLDFVVRRTDPYEIHIERIFADSQLWNNMVPKLEAFYQKFLLPELSCPRYGTVTGIRKPDCPWYEPQVHVSQTNRATCPALKSKDSLQLTQQEEVRKRGRHTCNINRHVKASRSTSPEHTNSAGTKPSNSGLPQHNCSKPSTSQASLNPEKSTSSRHRRKIQSKFVGRRIAHEWCMDEATNTTQWFKGTVLDVKNGKDGSPTAIYEVLYEGEDSPVEVENLTEDLESGSLLFIDI